MYKKSVITVFCAGWAYCRVCTGLRLIMRAAAILLLLSSFSACAFLTEPAPTMQQQQYRKWQEAYRQYTAAQELGDGEERFRAAQRAYAIASTSFPQGSAYRHSLLTSAQAVAEVHKQRNEYDQALAMLKEAQRVAEETYGAAHRVSAELYRTRAQVAVKAGYFAKADDLVRESIAVKARLLGATHRKLFDDYLLLGVINERAGRIHRAGFAVIDALFIWHFYSDRSLQTLAELLLVEADVVHRAGHSALSAQMLDAVLVMGGAIDDSTLAGASRRRARWSKSGSNFPAAGTTFGGKVSRERTVELAVWSLYSLFDEVRPSVSRAGIRMQDFLRDFAAHLDTLSYTFEEQGDLEGAERTREEAQLYRRRAKRVRESKPLSVQ